MGPQAKRIVAALGALAALLLGMTSPTAGGVRGAGGAGSGTPAGTEPGPPAAGATSAAASPKTGAGGNQAAGAAGGRWFEDVTRRAGLAVKHHNRVFHNPYAEIMAGYTALGAAAAVGDYDGDGFEDIFVTDSAEGGKNHLYHNNGDLTFTDVAEQAGVADGNDAENATADALWFDYNNDGRPDLLVVRFGHSKLYENLGNGKFKDVTKQAGLDRYMNSISAIAFDYDHDGYLDLFIGNYFQPVNLFHPSTPRFFPESFETANNGGGVVVYHNNGDGTFTDVTDKVGLKTSGWTLDLGHGDANNDGWDDLYVACDFGTDRFFLNNGDGTFTDKTQTAIGFDTKKGMNAEWGDYDNDGWLDIFVTNITDDYMREGNFLWHNNGNLTFTDVSRETGTYETGWGWAAKFFDYDNDGWLDLYVVNGWVSAGPESYVPDIFEMIVRPNVDLADARSWPPMGKKSLSGYEKKKLFHNEHGQLFRNEAARHGLDSTRDGRGIAVADFDNDGRLDLFVTNANDEPYLYHNVLPTGAHWAEFQLEGRKSNRDAVGTRLYLTTGGRRLLRFVDGGNGFASQSTKRVHFGLAGAATVDQLEVLWPSGLRQTFSGFAADHLYRIVEGQPALTAWQPRPSPPGPRPAPREVKQR
ncbi:MAG TPA: CRTAC1 family protein [Thermoanaerobaculia bacterium]|nr:CRTAC1 family protein [Thermoanaerobaculia bacterium]